MIGGNDSLIKFSSLKEIDNNEVTIQEEEHQQEDDELFSIDLPEQKYNDNKGTLQTKSS